ncbi:subtilisin-like protein [Lactarius quietus]|nr:subtilisin-like protein [Lactarius quietus]
MRCNPLSVLFTLAGLYLSLLGSLAMPHVPRWGGMRVMHAWSTVPQNWVSVGHPHAKTTIDLHLALKPHHEHALVDSLYEVSNPRHPKYGAYLSKEQVAELVAPHPDTLDLVSSWLKHHGVPSSSISTTLGGDWLAVINVSLSQANEMLGASYQLYNHVETNDSVIRTISYSLPEALHGHIETVVPTTYFASALTEAMKPRMHLSATVGAGTKTGSGELIARTEPTKRKSDKYVHPSFLRFLYKTSGYVPMAAERNMVGVVGYGGQYPSPQDLKKFMAEFRSDGEDAKFTVEQVNGGLYNPNIPGFEADLNIQYTEAIAYPTRHVFYSTGGSILQTVDPYLQWLKYVIGQKTVPQTITTSFGGYEFRVPPDQAARICLLFAQLGARGVSILFASGNSGVGDGDCTFRDRNGNSQVYFLPFFPASSLYTSLTGKSPLVGPYVTTVGGTTGGKTKENPEVAASISGGGFSNYFLRPPYQKVAVPSFLENLGNTYAGSYNPIGRGYPDLSAQAIFLSVVVGGQYGYVNGTSGAAPTVAAIISLLNDYLISKGKPPLGFLNTWLYSIDPNDCAFNDITSGSNPGCGTVGFPAVAGWDPVTGLGTPNFDILEEIVDNRLLNSDGSWQT